ncbi:MAG: hypothetical protein HXY40_05800 [Chloroflexi bacterium]|nr:hypothetical protein [Chloroflexota bacterium]
MFTENQQITLLFSVVFGLIAGFFLARRSEAREKIHGGLLPRFVNYLACSTMVAVVPSVIVAVILQDGLLFSLGMALSLLFVTIALLMLFAVFEHGPRRAALAQKVERGWTEQDARTSGL